MNNPSPTDIAARIRPAMTTLYVMYFRIAEQSDLTGPQLSIMTRLKEKGPLRISQIAREEGIRMPTASNALHQLERRELVTRVRDEQDRRGVRVQLTALGISELRRVGAEREKYLADMLATLDDEDLAKTDAFVDVVNRLSESYNAESVTPPEGEHK